MSDKVNICDAEATARERAKASTDVLLASLQRHHGDDVVAREIPLTYEPVALPPVRESISRWAKRQQALNPLSPPPARSDDAAIATVSVRDIQQVCALHYGITVLEMVSDRRTKEVIRPRQVAMYLAKELTTRSFPDLGRRFGNRDHTTVLHSFRKIERLLKTDARLMAEVDALRASLS